METLTLEEQAAADEAALIERLNQDALDADARIAEARAALDAANTAALATTIGIDSEVP